MKVGGSCQNLSIINTALTLFKSKSQAFTVGPS